MQASLLGFALSGEKKPVVQRPQPCYGNHQLPGPVCVFPLRSAASQVPNHLLTIFISSNLLKTTRPFIMPGSQRKHGDPPAAMGR